ncbi:MAG: M23 family metallopeptidase [Treponema sp.]|nr:M23 family metallopeptidase [Treponema sp.]
MQRQFTFAQVVLLFICCLFSFVTSIFGEDIHTVKNNETVYSIAISYGVSIDALMKLNNITDPKKLRVGQKLNIPEKLLIGGQGQSGASFIEYTVITGDTLFAIAKKNNVTVAALRAANGFSESRVLKAGDKLKIPAAGATSGGAVAARVKPDESAQGPAPPQRQAAGATPPAVTRRSTAEPLPKYGGATWPVEVRAIAKADGKLEGGVIVTSYASEPVRSLTGGTVKAAGPYFNFRNVVVVQSRAGYLYTYGGCERLSVKAGDRVGVGTELGRLDTGKDPQLLLMVAKDNKPVNPQTAPRD